jgi:hypothetical protein
MARSKRKKVIKRQIINVKHKRQKEKAKVTAVQARKKKQAEAGNT